MKAKPNVNFFFKDDHIVLEKDLKEEAKIPIDLKSGDIQQLFHGNKRDINFDTRKITEFRLGSKFKGIYLPMEFDDLKRKEHRLNRSGSPPISIKVLLFGILFFVVSGFVLQLLGYV